MKITLVVSCLIVLSLSGCANNKTFTTSIVGGAIGAAVSGGNPAAIAIGATSGLLIGAAADTENQPRVRRLSQATTAYDSIYDYNRAYYPSVVRPPFYPNFAFDYYQYVPSGSNVDIVFVGKTHTQRYNWTHSSKRRVTHADVNSFRTRHQSEFNQNHSNFSRNNRAHGNDNQYRRNIRNEGRNNSEQHRNFSQRNDRREERSFHNTRYGKGQGPFSSNHDRLRHNDRVRAKQHRQKENH